MERDELISSFINLTGCYDLELANKYLDENEWNLSRAYSSYEQSKDLPRPVVNDFVEAEIPQEPSISQYLKGAVNWVLSPLNNIFKPSARVPQARNPAITFKQYLQQLSPPNSPKTGNITLSTISQACQQANKLALIYIHQIEFGDVFVRTVLCNSEVISIINTGFIFLGILGNTDEGSEAIAKFSEDINAVFVILSGNEVLDRIEYLPSTDELIEFLLKFAPSHEEVFDETRYIREQQERELREAEKIMQLKTEEERKKKLQADKEVEEKKLQARKEQERKEEKLRALGEEPQPGEGVTQITFRLPGGEKVERRFLADCQVEMLKLFLDSLDLGNCEILSGFPPKVMSQGTLRDEGLVPRGLVHVRLAN